MDDISFAYEWGKSYAFDEDELFYLTAIAVLILNSKSSHDEHSQYLLMAVYDGVSDHMPSPLNQKIHQIIELSREGDPMVPLAKYQETLSILEEKILNSIDKESLTVLEEFILNNCG
ncbi:MAG TPA: hypothetical protein ENK87_03030 [Nitratifractor sp.]|nr:hypothetical protein [Nitratifractor sp.]HHD75031.1 hypothetical protein [Nitratifractor sp.]HHH20879.1 hypothetical protein [Nitratifractor sp.]